MNNQLRILEIQASLLGLDNIARHLRAAQTSNHSHHLAQAWLLATDEYNYFAIELADSIQDLMCDQVEAVMA